jgi:D-serine deaminase-like pyridoxal phosphate-dependent protein
MVNRQSYGQETEEYGMNTRDLDTPFVLIDMDKVERNLSVMQKIASSAGISLRPHIKTHKIPALAHKQIQAGAIGITVAKLGEAEVMVAAGITNILIAYPIVGEQKLSRLIALVKKAQITAAVDSYEVAEGIAGAAVRSGVIVDVVIEMDCGFGRVGVPPGDAVLQLAKQIVQLPGLRMTGILTFAGQSYDASNKEELGRIGMEEGRLSKETADLLRANGITVTIVSVGSTPSSRFASQVPGITEIRPGTYIFGDLMQTKIGSHQLEDCALCVKVTVISRPAKGRAVVDAGTKIFSMDGEDSPLGTGRGVVIERPGIKVAWFTEEHGMLELSEQDETLKIGDTLEIIPVHCCAVINMVDEVAAVRGNRVEEIWPVAGRGKSR